MLESLIVILPTAGAFAFAASSAKTRDTRIGIIILFFAMCMLWIHFYAQGYKWFEAEYPDWLYTTKTWTSCLALPLSYMVVCQYIGKNLLSASTVTLFLFAIINVIEYGAFSLDGVLATEDVDTANICFLYGGKAVFRIPSYCMVMVLQSIWIFYRTIYLSYAIEINHYHGSPRAKIIIRVILVLLASIMISAAMPDSTWENHTGRYFFFIYYAIGFTTLLVLIGKDFAVKPILDSNDEVAYLDRKPNFEEMAALCDKLYDEEKIYLIPGLKIENLAARLGTNRNYVAELMKKHYDTTFTAFTNARRVEEAKKTILANPDEKMEVIAGMCGFATAPTFTKTFKLATGLTPSSWLAKKVEE